MKTPRITFLIFVDSTDEEVLQQLIDDFWSWRQRTSPEFGTKYGIKNDYQDKLEQYTIAEWHQQKVGLIKLNTHKSRKNNRLRNSYSSLSPL